MLAVYTIVKTSDYGWGSAHTLILGVVAVAILAAFLVREATARTPLIPLRIFRSRNVSGANLVQALMIAGIFGMFFLGAVYMQRVLGLRPAPGGPGLPAGGVVDRDVLPVRRAAAQHEDRPAGDAAARAWC